VEPCRGLRPSANGEGQRAIGKARLTYIEGNGWVGFLSSESGPPICRALRPVEMDSVDRSDTAGHAMASVHLQVFLELIPLRGHTVRLDQRRHAVQKAVKESIQGAHGNARNFVHRIEAFRPPNISEAGHDLELQRRPGSEQKHTVSNRKGAGLTNLPNASTSSAPFHPFSMKRSLIQPTRLQGTRKRFLNSLPM